MNGNLKPAGGLSFCIQDFDNQMARRMLGFIVGIAHPCVLGCSNHNNGMNPQQASDEMNDCDGQEHRSKHSSLIPPLPSAYLRAAIGTVLVLAFHLQMEWGVVLFFTSANGF